MSGHKSLWYHPHNCPHCWESVLWPLLLLLLGEQWWNVAEVKQITKNRFREGNLKSIFLLKINIGIFLIFFKVMNTFASFARPPYLYTSFVDTEYSMYRRILVKYFVWYIISMHTKGHFNSLLRLKGVAPLITNPPTTSLTILKKKKNYITCDIWHLTHDTWHMTYDTWHVTVGGK